MDLRGNEGRGGDGGEGLAPLHAGTASRQGNLSKVGKSRRAYRGLPSTRGFGIFAARMLAVLAVIGAWQGLTAIGVVSKTFAGQPAEIAARMVEHEGSIVGATIVTIYEAGVGFCVAVLLGLAVAILFHEIPLLMEVFSPLFSAANSVPRIALAPLFVVWFGLGHMSRIVLVISLVFFVVFLSASAGFRSVDRDHVMLARVLGASRIQTFRYMVFISAVPAIVAGFELGIIYSVLGAVVGEMLGGSGGVGAELQYYAADLRMNTFFSYLLVLVVVTVLIVRVLKRIEQRVMRWEVVEFSAAATFGGGTMKKVEA